MRQQNKIETAIFLGGGALMVIGAGVFAFLSPMGGHQELLRAAAWLFFLGSIMFAVTQCLQSYKGNDIVVRRLKRIMTIADILFVFSGVLMLDQSYHFLLPLFSNTTGTGYLNYITWIVNKWVIVLLIAAILEMYTMHRIGHELHKNEREN